MVKIAVLKLTLKSEKLHRDTDVNILCPYFYDNRGGKLNTVFSAEPKKVLYLIHGGTDDYSCWVNNTMISVFSERYPNLLIVMPTVYDFHSMAQEDYFHYVAEELPTYIERWFCVSDNRKDRFIGGLSMGGYFAYRTALAYPDRYLCVGSFSSPLDIEEDMRLRHEGMTDYPAPEVVRDNPQRDLFSMLTERIKKGNLLPEMFLVCGTEDMTYPLNRKMKAFMEAHNLTHTYMEWPGDHNWVFWNEAVEKFLEWLPLKGEK